MVLYRTISNFLLKDIRSWSDPARAINKSFFPAIINEYNRSYHIQARFEWGI